MSAAAPTICSPIRVSQAIATAGPPAGSNPRGSLTEPSTSTAAQQMKTPSPSRIAATTGAGSGLWASGPAGADPAPSGTIQNHSPSSARGSNRHVHMRGAAPDSPHTQFLTAAAGRSTLGGEGSSTTVSAGYTPRISAVHASSGGGGSGGGGSGGGAGGVGTGHRSGARFVAAGNVPWAINSMRNTRGGNRDRNTAGSGGGSGGGGGGSGGLARRGSHASYSGGLPPPPPGYGWQDGGSTSGVPGGGAGLSPATGTAGGIDIGRLIAIQKLLDQYESDEETGDGAQRGDDSSARGSDTGGGRGSTGSGSGCGSGLRSLAALRGGRGDMYNWQPSVSTVKASLEQHQQRLRERADITQSLRRWSEKVLDDARIAGRVREIARTASVHKVASPPSSPTAATRGVTFALPNEPKPYIEYEEEDPDQMDLEDGEERRLAAALAAPPDGRGLGAQLRAHFMAVVDEEVARRFDSIRAAWDSEVAVEMDELRELREAHKELRRVHGETKEALERATRRMEVMRWQIKNGSGADASGFSSGRPTGSGAPPDNSRRASGGGGSDAPAVSPNGYDPTEAATRLPAADGGVAAAAAAALTPAPPPPMLGAAAPPVTGPSPAAAPSAAPTVAPPSAPVVRSGPQSPVPPGPENELHDKLQSIGNRQTGETGGSEAGEAGRLQDLQARLEEQAESNASLNRKFQDAELSVMRLQKDKEQLEQLLASANKAAALAASEAEEAKAAAAAAASATGAGGGASDGGGGTGGRAGGRAKAAAGKAPASGARSARAVSGGTNARAAGAAPKGAASANTDQLRKDLATALREAAARGQEAWERGQQLELVKQELATAQQTLSMALRQLTGMREAVDRERQRAAEAEEAAAAAAERAAAAEAAETAVSSAADTGGSALDPTAQESPEEPPQPPQPPQQSATLVDAEEERQPKGSGEGRADAGKEGAPATAEEARPAVDTEPSAPSAEAQAAIERLERERDAALTSASKLKQQMSSLKQELAAQLDEVMAMREQMLKQQLQTMHTVQAVQQQVLQATHSGQVPSVAAAPPPAAAAPPAPVAAAPAAAPPSPPQRQQVLHRRDSVPTRPAFRAGVRSQPTSRGSGPQTLSQPSPQLTAAQAPAAIPAPAASEAAATLAETRSMGVQAWLETVPPLALDAPSRSPGRSPGRRRRPLSALVRGAGAGAGGAAAAAAAAAFLPAVIEELRMYIPRAVRQVLLAPVPGAEEAMGTGMAVDPAGIDAASRSAAAAAAAAAEDGADAATAAAAAAGVAASALAAVAAEMVRQELLRGGGGGFNGSMPQVELPGPEYAQQGAEPLQYGAGPAQVTNLAAGGISEEQIATQLGGRSGPDRLYVFHQQVAAAGLASGGGGGDGGGGAAAAERSSRGGQSMAPAAVMVDGLTFMPLGMGGAGLGRAPRLPSQGYNVHLSGGHSLPPMQRSYSIGVGSSTAGHLPAAAAAGAGGGGMPGAYRQAAVDTAAAAQAAAAAAASAAALPRHSAAFDAAATVVDIVASDPRNVPGSEAYGQVLSVSVPGAPAAQPRRKSAFASLHSAYLSPRSLQQHQQMLDAAEAAAEVAAAADGSGGGGGPASGDESMFGSAGFTPPRAAGSGAASARALRFGDGAAAAAAAAMGPEEFQTYTLAHLHRHAHGHSHIYVEPELAAAMHVGGVQAAGSRDVSPGGAVEYDASRLRPQSAAPRVLGGGSRSPLRRGAGVGGGLGRLRRPMSAMLPPVAVVTLEGAGVPSPREGWSSGGGGGAAAASGGGSPLRGAVAALESAGAKVRTSPANPQRGVQLSARLRMARRRQLARTAGLTAAEAAHLYEYYDEDSPPPSAAVTGNPNVGPGLTPPLVEVQLHTGPDAATATYLVPPGGGGGGPVELPSSAPELAALARGLMAAKGRKEAELEAVQSARRELADEVASSRQQWAEEARRARVLEEELAAVRATLHSLEAGV